MKLAVIFCVTILAGYVPLYVEGSCPEGYCRHSSKCYLVVGLNVTWIDARSYCTTLGGTLLSIDSSVAQTAVEGALRRSKGTVYPGRFWLDFTDLLNPKDWKKMSTKKALTYLNWYSQFSYNGTTAENCVQMNESHDYKWTPISCAEKLNFVCYASG